jgi:hypothetical protein
LSFELEVFEEATGSSRSLTTAELDGVAFRGAMIRLRGQSGHVVEHRAMNGSSFTVRELIQAVVETERKTRALTHWFGGIDVHHVFFEGLRPAEGGVWEIAWGS